jgi:hypothetical protein
MAINRTRCAVLGGDVTIVTDLEGAVMQVICPEYEAASGSCLLKRKAREGGPLTQLLDRIGEHDLESRRTECHLR